jgi:hypothetical protein
MNDDRAELRGSGALAQGPVAVAASTGGVAVGGSVHGDIRASGQEPKESVEGDPDPSGP